MRPLASTRSVGARSARRTTSARAPRPAPPGPRDAGAAPSPAGACAESARLATMTRVYLSAPRPSLPSATHGRYYQYVPGSPVVGRVFICRSSLNIDSEICASERRGGHRENGTEGRGPRVEVRARALSPGRGGGAGSARGGGSSANTMGSCRMSAAPSASAALAGAAGCRRRGGSSGSGVPPDTRDTTRPSAPDAGSGARPPLLKPAACSGRPRGRGTARFGYSRRGRVAQAVRGRAALLRCERERRVSTPVRRRGET